MDLRAETESNRRCCEIREELFHIFAPGGRKGVEEFVGLLFRLEVPPLGRSAFIP